MEWRCCRSGPVHGSVSVQKAESAALANGSGIRGGSKAEGGDGAAQVVGKAERGGLAERERSNGKGGAKYVLWSGCGLRGHVLCLDGLDGS